MSQFLTRLAHGIEETRMRLALCVHNLGVNLAFLFRQNLDDVEHVAWRGGSCARDPINGYYVSDNIHDARDERVDEIEAFLRTLDGKVTGVIAAVSRLEARVANIETRSQATVNRLEETRRLTDAARTSLQSQADGIDRTTKRLEAISTVEQRLRALETSTAVMTSLSSRMDALERKLTVQEHAVDALGSSLPEVMREVATEQVEAVITRMDQDEGVTERALANADNFARLVSEDLKA